jgi:predicted nucleic acid-binding protein
LSLTDAVSFAVMEIHAIREAFTFDRDFQDAGFTVATGKGTR